MNPQKPDVLYAATYDMQRTPWMSRSAGPDSAIYKTVDGGATWSKLTNGLPTGRIGKIGLDIYAKNPEILYVALVNANPGASPGTLADARADSEPGSWAARCIAPTTAARAGRKSIRQRMI